MKNIIKQGKGLMEQISSDNKREYNLHTGYDGMNIFMHTMRVQHLTTVLLELIKANKVTSEENTRLSQMITSPDRESQTMAELIMNQK